MERDVIQSDATPRNRGRVPLTLLEQLMRSLGVDESGKPAYIALMQRIGLHPKSWSRWCRRPHTIPSGYLHKIMEVVEKKNNRTYSLPELFGAPKPASHGAAS